MTLAAGSDDLLLFFQTNLWRRVEDNTLTTQKYRLLVNYVVKYAAYLIICMQALMTKRVSYNK